MTEKLLNQQIKRLMSLPFAPSADEDARLVTNEFRRVLQGNCRTDAHLEAVVTHLMNLASRIPPPAEVLAACGAVSAPESTQAPNGCAACGGTGFKRFTRTVHTPAGAYEADYASPCGCARGQWRASANSKHHGEGGVTVSVA